MGQQQLLLLVLGIVIVGLAVVVGIQAFGENQKKANADALVNDAIRIASDAQAWRLKPAAFGGGAGNEASTPWNNIGFEQLGYETETNGAAAGEYGNLNGTFSMAVSSGTLTITAQSHASTGLNNQVVVEVTGTKPGDISTTVSTVSD